MGKIASIEGKSDCILPMIRGSINQEQSTTAHRAMGAKDGSPGRGGQVKVQRLQ